MSMKKNVAIYCRDMERYGTFEIETPHNTVAYQAGSAMTFIVDKKLDFCGLYVDDADSFSAIDALSRECAAGKIDAIIVRDLDVFGDDAHLLTLEDEVPVPIIGVEDFDSTKEKLNLDTLQYEKEAQHHSDEHKQAIHETTSNVTKKMQDEGQYVGRIPYGYVKVGDDLVADSEKAVVVRDIFNLFVDGYKINDIRKYLKSKGIKSPTGADEWNIPGVKRILQRETYYGDAHIEPLVSREIYEAANEMLTTKTIKKDNQEPDYFPMAVCDVCGKKLTFKRSRGTYLCDRHTGEFSTEKRLEHEPRISVQELSGKVIQQYNDHLADMGYFQDKPIWMTDLCIEERGRDKIALGEKLLALDPQSKDYIDRVKDATEPYEGLWLDWMRALKNLKDDFFEALIRRQLPNVWRPMYKFDPNAIRRSVSSIRLKEDGSIETHFKAETAFAGQGKRYGK